MIRKNTALIVGGILSACTLLLCIPPVTHTVLFPLLGSLLVIASGYFIGRRTLHMSHALAVCAAPLLSLPPLIIGGSFAYYTGGFTPERMPLIFILSLLWAFWALSQKTTVPAQTPSKKLVNWQEILLLVVYSGLLALHWLLLWKGKTTDSVLGPWVRLSPLFFVQYFLSTLIVITLLVREHTHHIISLSILVLHALSSSTAVLILFPLGMGFDPIIHQATEYIIAVQGFVEPKTFYYIGHYTVVVFLSRLLSLPIQLIDMSLVPLLFSFTIPSLSIWLFNLIPASKYISALSTLGILALPYSFIVSSTPWSFSLVLGLAIIICILASLYDKSKEKLILASLLSSCAVLVHPLSGIPLFGATLMACTALTSRRRRTIFMVALFVLFSVSIPLSFILNSTLSGQATALLHSFNLSGLEILMPSPSLFLSRFSGPLDFTYLWIRIAPFAVLLAGIFLCIREKITLNRKLAFCGASGLVFLNGLLTTGFIDFPSLISYERAAYSDRLFFLSLLFWLPWASIAGAQLFKKLYTRSHPLALFVTLLVAGSITASLYASYPRNDAFTSYHGYTVSAADIETVHTIHADADTKDFIVLSNQVTASAAIKEYGFKQYFPVTINNKEELLFYYPIPTSSPLYDAYMHMLSTPNRSIMTSAMERVGVNRAYFVIHGYEEHYASLIEKTSRVADASFTRGSGTITIFRFDNK